MTPSSHPPSEERRRDAPSRPDGAPGGPGDESSEEGGPTGRRTALVGILLMVVAAGALVASSLDRPEPPTYAPRPPAPAEVGDRRVGPAVHTVDARDGDRWVLFDFSSGSVVESPDPTGWDLAFRRLWIGANGGEGLAGEAGVADLGPVPFDSVREAPGSGYEPSGADTVNAVVAEWYDYSMWSHLLTPRPRVYAVRTADGRYAKLEILSYYCPEAVAGCMTFRYVYQGSGGRSFEP